MIRGIKKRGPAGCLEEMKGGSRHYAAEATAEHVGQKARNLGATLFPNRGRNEVGCS